MNHIAFHTAGEVMKSVKFGDLKSAVANLRCPDQHHFRGTALAKLGKVYDPYPTAISEERFCFLLPKGASPREIAELDETVAAKRLIVLREDGRTWLQVWPSAATTGGPIESGRAASQVLPTSVPTAGDDEPELIFEEE